MKLAILSITSQGLKTANQILEVLKHDPTVIRVDSFHKDVKYNLTHVIGSYDCIVGVMATGIMVRSICPLLKSKVEDPAVLVVGENGKHVISLVSGHMGGANYYTHKVAGALGSVPVITTATDLQGKMGIDSLAFSYYLQIDEPKLIKEINRALIDNEKVELIIPSKFQFLESHPQVIRSYRIQIWDESFIRASVDDFSIDLTPNRLVAGIGSRKDVPVLNVINAIRSAFQSLHLPVDRLDGLATAEMKKDEAGIIETAENMGLPIEIVPLDDLKNFSHPNVTHSKLVEREFGVSGVSEPSALLSAGENSRLILKKTVFDGVTVAVAVNHI